jgi:hypothetical protein
MSISTNLPASSADALPTIGGPLTAEERVAAAEAARRARVGADWQPPDELVQKIVAMTQKLFPGEVTTEIDCDPSEPDDPWMNFWVVSDLGYMGARGLHDRWHQEIADLGVRDETRYRLLVTRP